MLGVSSSLQVSLLRLIEELIKRAAAAAALAAVVVVQTDACTFGPVIQCCGTVSVVGFSLQIVWFV